MSVSATSRVAGTASPSRRAAGAMLSRRHATWLHTILLAAILAGVLSLAMLVLAFGVHADSLARFPRWWVISTLIGAPVALLASPWLKRLTDRFVSR